MKYIRSAYFWILLWCFTFFFFLYLIANHFFKGLFFSRSETQNSAHRIACLWGRGLLWLIPGWSYSIEGAHLLPKAWDEPVVVVANHQSSVDICVVLATRFQFRWLSKIEAFRLPLIGSAMRWAGYVPIKRGDKKSHRLALQKSVECLRSGISMIFFPEGSRSLTGELGSFKSGAFRTAAEANVRILPIAIKGSANLMKKGSLIFNTAHVKVKVLPPLRQPADETLQGFIARIRDMIKTELEKSSDA